MYYLQMSILESGNLSLSSPTPPQEAPSLSCWEECGVPFMGARALGDLCHLITFINYVIIER